MSERRRTHSFGPGDQDREIDNLYELIDELFKRTGGAPAVVPSFEAPPPLDTITVQGPGVDPFPVTGLNFDAHFRVNPNGDLGDIGLNVEAKSPLTTEGDVYYRDDASDQRLPVGNAGEILKVVSDGLGLGGLVPGWRTIGLSIWLPASLASLSGGAAAYTLTTIDADLPPVPTVRLPNGVDSSAWFLVPYPRYAVGNDNFGIRVYVFNSTGASAEDLTKNFVLLGKLLNIQDLQDLTTTAPGNYGSSTLTIPRKATGVVRAVDKLPGSANLGGVSSTGGSMLAIRVQRDGTDTAGTDLVLFGVELLVDSYT